MLCSQTLSNFISNYSRDPKLSKNLQICQAEVWGNMGCKMMHKTRLRTFPFDLKGAAIEILVLGLIISLSVNEDQGQV